MLLPEYRHCDIGRHYHVYQSRRSSASRGGPALVRNHDHGHRRSVLCVFLENGGTFWEHDLIVLCLPNRWYTRSPRSFIQTSLRQWTKAPPDENLCVVITKTYQLEEEEKADGDEQDDAQNDEESALEQPVEVPDPRVSLLARLGRGWHNEADSSVSMDIGPYDAGATDKAPTARRMRNNTDYTADTFSSMASDISSVPSSTGSVRPFRRHDDLDGGVTTIPETSEHAQDSPELPR